MALSDWVQRLLGVVRRDRGRGTQWLYDEAEPQLYVTQLEQRRVLTASLAQQSLTDPLLGGSSAATGLGSSTLNGQPLDAQALYETRPVSQDSQAAASFASAAPSPPMATQYVHTAEELRSLLSPAGGVGASSDNSLPLLPAAEQPPAAAIPAMEIAGTTAPRTQLALDASNNLVITPASSGAELGVLTIQSDAVQQAFVITDASAPLSTGIAGAKGGGSQQVTIPFAAVSGDKLIVEAGDAQRTLVLDFSSGPLTKSVEFHGGQASSGILVLTGGSVKSVDYAFQGKSDGEVTIGTDSGATTVRFTGVQAFVDDLCVEDRGFQLGGESETITLSDGAQIGDHQSLFQSSLGTSVTFSDPGVSLTIRDSRAGTAADTIDVNGLDATFSANLTIQAGAADTVTFDGFLDLGSGDLTVTGGRIGVTQTITTHDATIELSGTNAVTISSTAAITDARGTVRVQAPTLSHDGLISAVGGGSVYLDSGDFGTTLVSGAIDVTSLEPGQVGGTVHLLGGRVGLLDHARIDASGNAGGGTILIGGDYQGKNANIRNAARTYIGPDAKIVADAVQRGHGGKVIVWSDEVTRFYGNITARGGELAGDGGFVETSGKDYLEADGRVTADGPQGTGGMWLLDPRDVTISTSTSGGAFDGGTPDIFTPTSNNANADSNTIETALNNGTSVTITTGSTGGQAGDVTVASTITKSAGGVATFRIDAAGAITVSQAIASTSGALSVELNAGGAVTINASITTVDGGAINITSGADFTLASGIVMSSASGAITVNTAAAKTMIVDGDITTGGAGVITLVSDNMSLAGNITTGNGVVTLQAATDATAIQVGATAADGAGTLGLLDTELTKISTTGGVTVGSATNTGGITVVGAANLSSYSGLTTLLSNSGSITVNATLTTPGSATLQTTSGNIAFGASGAVTASGNTVTLSAAGGNLGGNAAVFTNVTATTLNATASSGIGSTNALETVVSTLSFANTTSAVQVTNTLAGGLTVSGTNAGTGAVNVTEASGNLTVGASDIVTNSGAVTLTASAANKSIIAASGSDIATTGGSTTGAAITLVSDNMSLGGAITAGNGLVTLRPRTNATAIQVGATAADAAGTLGLLDTELTKISTTGGVTVGSATNTGGITVVGAANVSAAYSGLTTLQSNSGPITVNGTLTTAGSATLQTTSGNIAFGASGAVTASGNTVTLSAAGGNLGGNAAVFTNVTATTLNATASSGIGSTNALETVVSSLSFANTTSAVQVTNALAGGLTVSGTNAGTGAVNVTEASGNLTVGASDIVTNSGAVTLTASGLNKLITAASGSDIVTNNSGGGAAITLVADEMSLAGNLTAGNGLVTLRPTTNATAIQVGATAADAAGTLGLLDTELTKISTTGGVTVGSATNTGGITVVGAANVSAAYSGLTTLQSNSGTITVNGTLTTAGSATLQTTSGNIAFGASGAVTASGNTVTLSAAGGNIDGNAVAFTNVTASTLSATASSGIGVTILLETIVSTLSFANTTNAVQVTNTLAGGVTVSGTNAGTGPVNVTEASGTLTVGAADIVTNSGVVMLIASAANKSIIAASGSDIVTTGGSTTGEAITLVSDNMSLGGAITAGNGLVALRPRTNGTAIQVGATAADGSLTLGLLDTELTKISTTGGVTVGSTTNTGGITVVGAANVSAAYSGLTMLESDTGTINVNATLTTVGGVTLQTTSGNIAFGASGAVTASGYTVTLSAAGGNIGGNAAAFTNVTATTLNATASSGIGATNALETIVSTVSFANTTNAVQVTNTLAGGLTVSGTNAGTGAVNLTEASGNLTVGASDIVTNSGAVTLTASAANKSITAASGSDIVTTGGSTTGAAITLASDNMSLGGAITAGNGLVTLKPNANTVAIQVGATAADGAGTLGLLDTELTKIITTGGVTVGSATNTGGITVVGAANVSAAYSGLTTLQSNSGPLTVNGTLTTAGSATLQTTSGNIAFGASGAVTSSGNTVTLSAAGGNIDGNATTFTNVTATTLNATASSGIGSTNALETIVSTLSFANTSNAVQVANTLASGVTVSGTNAGTGAVNVTETSGNLTVGASDIVTNSGAVTLTASGSNKSISAASSSDLRTNNSGGGAAITLVSDNMSLGGAITAGSGLVTLQPFTAGTPIDVGGPDTATPVLGISNAEFQNISAASVQIGSAAAGDITVSANIQKPISGLDETLVLKTAGSIVVNGSVAITSADAQKLAVTFNADADANTAGAIVMNPGSQINSNGGDITFGGGANPATTAASGTTQHGIFLGNATLSAGSGNITLHGKGYSTSGSDLHGVHLDGGTSVQTTSGAIAIYGTGGNGSSGNFGVVLNASATQVTSATGSITITGQGGGGSATFNAGVMISGATVQSTGSAAVTINGTGGGSTAAAAPGGPVGIIINNGAVQSVDGNIQLTGQGAVVTGSGFPGNAHGVLMDGSSAKVRSTGNAQIIINATGGSGGNGANDGLHMQNSATITSATGNVSVTATGGGGPNSAGVLMNSSTIQSTGSAALTIDANPGGGPGIILTSSTLGSPTAAGTITITTDQMGPISASTVQGTGQLVLQPKTPNTQIGLGDGATGPFILVTPVISSFLVDGFAGITIGRASDGTGAVDINTSAFKDNLTVVGGSIAVTDLNAGTNAVTLTARTGAITDGDGATTTDVTGSTVTLSAITGIGGTGANASLEVDATTLQATNTTFGGIFLNATGTGGDAITANAQTAGNIEILGSTETVTLANLDTATGNITVNLTGQDLVATDVVAGANGDISLTTTSSGGITLGAVTATGDDVTINAAGAVTDGNAATNNVTATTLGMTGTAIGTFGGAPDAIETSVATLTASATSGDLNVAQTGNVTAQLTANSGAAKLTVGSTLTISSPWSGDSFDVDVDGDITINSNVTTDTATGMDFNSTGGNIAIGAGATLNSTTNAGAVSLTSNDISIHGTAAINAGTGTVSLAPNAGRTIDLGGAGSSQYTLASAEFNRITAAGVIRVGRSDAGTISLSATINNGAAADTLHLTTGSNITGFGGIIETNLAAEAVSGAQFSSSTDVQTAAVRNTGSGSVGVSGANGFTVGSVDGVNGVSNAGGIVVLTAVAGDLTISNTTAAYDVDATSSITVTLSGNDKKFTIATGADVRATSGSHGFRADKMDLAGTITATGQFVSLRPQQDSDVITLGSSSDAAANTLELSSGELGRIDAYTLRIGSLSSAAITIGQDISPAASVLSLTSGNSITGTAGGILGDKSLALILDTGAAGTINLTDPDTAFSTLAVAVAGKDVTLVEANGFDIDLVDGRSGIQGKNVSLTAASGGVHLLNTGAANDINATGTVAITLQGNDATLTIDPSAVIASTAGIHTYTADEMVLSGTINAGSQRVTLKPYQATDTINLGSTGSTADNTLEISNTELGNVTAGVLVIGSSTTGGVNLSASISPAGTSTLRIESDAGLTTTAQANTITVANVALAVDDQIGTSGSRISTATTNLAAESKVLGDIFLNETAAGVTVTTVDGLSGIVTADGQIDLAVSGTLTVSQPITAGGTGRNITLTTTASGNISLGALLTAAADTVTLNAAGAITDGNATANNITATTAVMVAATGIGTVGDPLETTVSNLEASGGSAGVFLTNTGALTIGDFSGLTPDGVKVTGGDIKITASSPLTVNDDVLNTGGGNIELTATNDGGNDDDLAINALVQTSGGDGSIILSAGHDLLINNAPTAGAEVFVAGSGTITTEAVNNTSLAANATVQSAGGTISMTTDAIAVDEVSAVITATAAGVVLIRSTSNNRAIDLGTETTGQLSLTDGELDRITAGTLRIGRNDATPAGAINVSSSIDTLNTGVLHLITGSTVSGAGSIIEGSLAIEAGGAVTLTSTSNDVTNLAITTAAAGTIQYTDASGFTVTLVDSVTGITTTDGSITLLASDGALVVDTAITAAGTGSDVVLDANGAGDNDDVTLNDTVTAAGDQIDIRASRDILQPANNKYLIADKVVLVAGARIGTAAGDAAIDTQATTVAARTGAATTVGTFATGGIFLNEDTAGGGLILDSIDSNLTVAGTIFGVTVGTGATNGTVDVRTEAGDLFIGNLGVVQSSGTGWIVLEAGGTGDLLLAGSVTANAALGGDVQLEAGADIAADMGVVTGDDVFLKAGGAIGCYSGILKNGSPYWVRTAANQLGSDAGGSVQILEEDAVTITSVANLIDGGSFEGIAAPNASVTVAVKTAGASLTVANSTNGQDTIRLGGGGFLDFWADEISIQNDGGGDYAISAGSVCLETYSADVDIRLGALDQASDNTLDLDQSELSEINATDLSLYANGGSSNNITLVSNVSVVNGTSVLLYATGEIDSSNAGYAINVKSGTGNLALSARGDIGGTNAFGTSVGTLAASTSNGTIAVTESLGGGALQIGRVTVDGWDYDGVSATGAISIATTNGALTTLATGGAVSTTGVGALITLTAGGGSANALTLNNTVTSAGGEIELNATGDVALANTNADVASFSGGSDAGLIDVNADTDGNGAGAFSVTAAGASLSSDTTNDGRIEIDAADFILSGTINAGTSVVHLAPTAGRAITLGAGGGATTLFRVSDGELDAIAAERIEVGYRAASGDHAASGTVTIDGNVTPAGTTTLVINSGSWIDAFGPTVYTITEDNLAFNAVLSVGDGSLYLHVDAGTLAVRTTTTSGPGNVNLADPNAVTVGSVGADDGGPLLGITANNGNIFLVAQNGGLTVNEGRPGSGHDRRWHRTRGTGLAGHHGPERRRQQLGVYVSAWQAGRGDELRRHDRCRPDGHRGHDPGPSAVGTRWLSNPSPPMPTTSTPRSTWVGRTSSMARPVRTRWCSG